MGGSKGFEHKPCQFTAPYYTSMRGTTKKAPIVAGDAALILPTAANLEAFEEDYGPYVQPVHSVAAVPKHLRIPASTIAKRLARANGGVCVAKGRGKRTYNRCGTNETEYDCGQQIDGFGTANVCKWKS